MKKTMNQPSLSRRLLLSFISTTFLLITSTSFAEEQKKPFKVGLISILSGQYSDIGQAIANAGQLAIDDYNSAHPTEKVEYVLEDDGADPKKALTSYNKLKDIDRADIIIPISTFATTSLRTVINNEKRLTFTIGNEPYEPEDDYIYMISPAATPGYKSLGEYVAKKIPEGKIGVFVGMNEAYYRFARAVKEGLGETRAEWIELPADATDLTSFATVVRTKDLKGIVFTCFPNDIGRLLKALITMKVKLPPLFIDESIDNSLSDLKMLIGDVSMFIGSDQIRYSTRKDPEFAKRYAARFGSTPKSWTDFGYDVVALALSLKDKPVEEAREWLKNNTYHGISGDIKFDGVGLREPVFDIVPFVPPVN